MFFLKSMTYLTAFLSAFSASAEIEFRITHIEVQKVRYYQDMTAVIGPNHAANEVKEVSEPTSRKLSLEILSCELDGSLCRPLGQTRFVSVRSADWFYNEDGSKELSVKITDPEIERRILQKQVEIKAVVHEKNWRGISRVADKLVNSVDGSVTELEAGYPSEADNCPFLMAELKSLGVGLKKIDCRFKVEITPIIR